MMIGGNTERKVVEDDMKAYDVGGFGAMIQSIIARTRCPGVIAVEIVRDWLDVKKAPVDEAAFLKANERCKAAQPA